MEFVADLKNFPAADRRQKIVAIVSNESPDSQEQAGLLVQWFQAAGWKVLEAAPGKFIGKGPIAYQIGDGIIVSGPLDDADAEAATIALCKNGFEVSRDVLPADNPHREVVVEVGNLRSPNGNSS
jgi:hypothetical protein